MKLIWRDLAVLVVVAIIFATCCGCAQRGKAKLGDLRVTSPTDASAPSTLNRWQVNERTTIPKGSVVKVTEIEAIGGAAPSRTTEYTFAEAAEQVRTELTEAASAAPPRAPDQTVALQKAKSAESRPLLYAAIVCALAGVAATVLKWPSVGMTAFLASVAFFMAWKVTGLPDWFWLVGICALVAGAAIVLGYKRAEWDMDNDGTPDFLQKKITTTSTVTEGKQ